VPRGSTTSTPLPPARFAYDSVTWKEILYLLLNLPTVIVGFVYVVTAVTLGIGLSVTVIGLPLLAYALIGCRLLGPGGARPGPRSARRPRGRAAALRAGTMGYLPWLGAALRDRWGGGTRCTSRSGCRGASSPSPSH